MKKEECAVFDCPFFAPGELCWNHVIAECGRGVIKCKDFEEKEND